MNPQPSADILVRIDTLDQLFNDPVIDPFSDKPALILGKAALIYAIRQELSRGFRDWRGKRLVIQLPAEQINPDLHTQLVNAVRKYTAVRQAENLALIRISRWRSLAGLTLALTLALVLIALLVIALNTVLTSLSASATGLLTGLAGIFVWATIWNPFDRLMYEWLGPWMENRILHSMMNMEILVVAEPASAGRVTS
jgi:hypothetical protein